MTETTSDSGNWKPRFFIIWGGQAISLIGSSIVQFALIWWLTQLTDSTTVLALASIMDYLPQAILFPIVGAYVDRWNRRRVMVIADAVIMLSTLVLVFLFWSETIQVWHVLVIFLVRTIGGIFHWTAMQASTTMLVPPEHLTRVAGLNQTMNGVRSIACPPLGALLLSLMMMHNIMLIDIVTALAAIVPLLFIAIPQPARREEETGQKPSMWADMREGLQFVWHWKGMLILIGAAMIFKIATTPASAFLPLLVTRRYQGGAGELSALEAAVGVGIIIGGLALSAWGGFRRRVYTLILGLSIGGWAFLPLGLAPADKFWLAVAAMFFFGLTVPFVDGPLMAILQSTVPPEKQGRVFSLLGSMISITSPLSLAVAGPVCDVVGLEPLYILAGLLCGGLGVAMFFIPAIANIEQHPLSNP